jgi:hypothetical protein
VIPVSFARHKNTFSRALEKRYCIRVLLLLLALGCSSPSIALKVAWVPSPELRKTGGARDRSMTPDRGIDSNKVGCVYTSCYCEENTYLLCERLLDRPDRTPEQVRLAPPTSPAHSHHVGACDFARDTRRQE